MPHINEHLDFTVEVFVVFDGKVLLRKHDKYGIWLGVGGHIEKDEDPNETALREVKEEIGLDVQLLDTRFYKGDGEVIQLIAPISVNRHRISDSHEHVSFIYLAKASGNEVVPENSTDEWKWCTKEDIDNMFDLQDQVAFYAKKAIDLII
ncbi:NUDIX domain-containing protein [Patescibacteria group bacterium]|nr:MAG: NUDIX domain-containing protein [Patescibacteria group bacterium]